MIRSIASVNAPRVDARDGEFFTGVNASGVDVRDGEFFTDVMQMIRGIDLFMASPSLIQRYQQSP